MWGLTESCLLMYTGSRSLEVVPYNSFSERRRAMRALNLLAVAVCLVVMGIVCSPTAVAGDRDARNTVVVAHPCSVCGVVHAAGHCAGRAVVGTGQFVVGTATDGGATVVEIVGDGLGFVENGASRIRNFFYRTGRRVRKVFDYRR